MTYEQKRSAKDWMKIASPILSALAICVTFTIKMAEGVKIVVSQGDAIIHLTEKVSQQQVDISLINSKENDLDKRVTRIEVLTEK